MNTAETNTLVVEGYAELLESLSLDNKLDLIARLTASVKTDLAKKTTLFKEAFGALETTKSAEELIEEIRSSRVFNRQIEPF